MACSGKEEGVSNNEQFIGNLLVDALDDCSRKQQFNVEFAFFRDTTVNTVLDDLEEALKGMRLRLEIPKDQCALAYDRNRHDNHRDMSGDHDVSVGCGGCKDAAGLGDDGVAILSGEDLIFEAPEVEAFYSLNRRCGLTRVATFLLVERAAAVFPPRGGTFSAPRERGGRAGDDGDSAANGLTARLLPRGPECRRVWGAGLPADGDRGALRRVRAMVAAAEKSILAARHAQWPRREPHWSLRMNRPPSRQEWLRAVEAEAAAYDRLAAKLGQNTAEALERHDAAHRALEGEVAQLHERIDDAKINVAKRQALQERTEELKIEIEAQRKKERELLQALEKAKEKQMQQQSLTPNAASSFRFFLGHSPQPPPPPPSPPPSHAATATVVPPPPPSSSRMPSMQHDSRFSFQYPLPPQHEPGPNYSTIHGLASGTDAATGSHFLSPSLREEVRQALSPRGISPMGAQQQGSRPTDLQRLRQLAGELSHHLRLPNPNPAERQRLMGEIRALRQQIERQQTERSRVSSSSFFR